MYLDSGQLKPLTFDLVANYRADAHLFTPYGFVVPKGGNDNKSSSSSFGSSQAFEGGKTTKQVAWLVSNCKTPSRREEYVEELIRVGNLSVDIYGDCASLWGSDKSCLPTQSKACYEMIEREYRFYLSFENAFCR